MNGIDRFPIIGRRAGLDKGRVTGCPGLAGTEKFPGTQGIQTRNGRWEKWRYLACHSYRDETFLDHLQEDLNIPSSVF